MSTIKAAAVVAAETSASLASAAALATASAATHSPSDPAAASSKQPPSNANGRPRADYASAAGGGKRSNPNPTTPGNPAIATTTTTAAAATLTESPAGAGSSKPRTPKAPKALKAPAATAEKGKKTVALLTSPTPIADIGINLAHQHFASDMAHFLRRAAEANVTTMVITGTNMHSSVEALRLARAHGMHATVGVHPHDAKSCNGHTIPKMREMFKSAETAHLAVAVGECGLDFDR